MELNNKIIGSGSPLIILHGLFGSLDNWMTIAKALEETRKIYLLDLRNHGKSPHSDVFDYNAMAEDIEEFTQKHNLDKFDLLGHSMGGKAAIKFALSNPGKVNKLIVVDIGPKFYPVHHALILRGLKSLALANITSRDQADKILAEHIADFGTRQFLLKNLQRNESGFGWKMNLPAINDNIENVGEDLTGLGIYNHPTLFIRGKNSDYIKDSDFEQITTQFPVSEIKTIENAGHWVHAEQPEKLLEVLSQILNLNLLS